METDNKRLKREFKENPRPSGVFLIRNTVNGKVLVGTGLDIAGIINRYRFQLTKGSHHNKKLQADWNEFGGEKFDFEIVDQISASEGVARDPRADLKLLEELWLEKLQPFDERGYNERKQSREQMLRRIAAKRTGEF
jgi:hypothetical protein